MIIDHIELVFIGALALFALWRIQLSNSKQKAAKKYLAGVVASNLHEPASLHPEIDPGKCAGCAACTRVCPEGDILKMIDHKAVLVGATKCVGHGECERACPMSAITLVFGTKTRGVDIPRVTTNYETNVAGLYIAGELGGMGLIRNAVKQGFISAEHAIKNMDSGVSTQYDLVIVGAGPAGMSASLVAVAHGKKYLTLEQNTFGGTVANFPRQKIVMSRPAELPMVGEMSFPDHKVSKEELLAYWAKVRKKTGLKITEQTKFEGLENLKTHFVVKTSKGEFTAKKVILALGVRGTPRRLGLPNEDLPKVTYTLLDPEQYQNKNIAVVGGGNAAAEVATMLANPKLKNSVHMLVRGPAMDRCNEDNKNRVETMTKQGRIKLYYESSVKKIERDHLEIEVKGKQQKVSNDFLFVMAGADLPHKFLMSLGVNIDKKFGEGLAKAR